MNENIDPTIDSNEAALMDAGIVVNYTEYPTVGQQVVTALISVAVPVVAGFGVFGAITVGQTIAGAVKSRRARRKAAKLESVEPTTVPSDPTE